MPTSNISAYLTNTSVVGSQDTASPTLAYSYLLRVAFGLIAFLAFTENSLLCVVILRNYGMLRSAYNVLIFSLAVTDMLTGNLLCALFLVFINKIELDRRELSGR